jgi:SMODS-associating 2TM, beta-strand rich effector domain
MRVRPDNFKRLVYFVAVLALLSYGIVRVFNLGIDAYGIKVPVWLETPSVVGVLVFLYTIFDSYLWHSKLFWILRLVDFPDLRGRWTGRMTSSWNNANKAAVLEITQTSSSIVVALYTMNSESVSQTAEFEVRRADGRPVLHYIYENHPYSPAPGSMERHEGTVALTYFAAKRMLEGSYYTGRGRQTFGTMTFYFQGQNLSGRFLS